MICLNNLTGHLITKYTHAYIKIYVCVFVCARMHGPLKKKIYLKRAVRFV